MTAVGLRRILAFLQRRLQHSLNLSQVTEPVIDFSQPIFNERLYFSTGRRRAAGRSKECLHVIQREPNRLRGPDELEFALGLLAVEPIVARTAIFRLNQPDPFVVADRRGGNIGCARQLADGVPLAHPVFLTP